MVPAKEVPPHNGGVQQTGRGGDCEGPSSPEGALPEPGKHPLEADGQIAYPKEVSEVVDLMLYICRCLDVVLYIPCLCVCTLCIAKGSSSTQCHTPTSSCNHSLLL